MAAKTGTSKFALLVKLLAECLGEPEEHLAQDASPAGRAASVAFLSPSKRVLLLRRADSEENFPGHWAFPGGKVDEGEDHEQAARRESKEEIGREPDALTEFDRKLTARNWEHVTYTSPATEEFEPKINGEHSEYKWAAFDDLPAPIHPGVDDTLKNLAKSHPLGLAQDGLALDYNSVGKHGIALDYAIALDRESVRETDTDGHLHVKLTNISKATVSPYIGKEIPNFEALGLDPKKIYRLLRDPEELEKAAATFNGKPLLHVHKPLNANEHPYEKTVGATGNDAVYEHPYLRNSIVVWPKEHIEGIKNGDKKELSAGYRYRADMTPGVYEGEPFDGVMRDIVGNHMALVEDGRAGPDVVVGDAVNPQIAKELQVKNLKTRTALTAKGALLAYLVPKLAMDAKIDLSSVVSTLTRKNFKSKKAEVKGGIEKLTKGKFAQDASLEGLEQVLDMIEGEVANTEGEDDINDAVEDDPAVSGLDAEQMMAHLKDKFPEAHDSLSKMMTPAKDADLEDKDKDKDAKDKDDKDKDKDKPAMDENTVRGLVTGAVTSAVATERKRQNDIRDAERVVHPYIGHLAIACDSAGDVYRHALKALEINVDGVHDSALRTILEMQPLPGRQKEPIIMAQDSAGSKDFNDRYAGASRIRQL